MRVCKKCKQEKELTEFLTSSECKDGYRYTCKECKRKKYIKKGPCKTNSSWFKKGHKFISGGEKGWIAKGQRLSPSTEFKKGQRPPNFIDGLANSRYRKLNKRKYRKVREEVLKRDGEKCVRCKCKSDILHVHHIIPLRIDPDRAYDLENLMTVCPLCHIQIERGR